jgi:RHS repeat-associated protein
MFNASCEGHGGAGAASSIAGAVYYHHDNLQGVDLETDDQGAVVAETAFDPFGGDLHPTTEPYAFTGKERDSDTGLYDFGARAYDPKLGLFLSPDPAILGDPGLAIDDPQLLGVYGYARNNPTTHVDSDGRFPHILIGALIGAAIGGGAYLVKAAITKDFSVKGALAATGGGAIAGAVAAATCGASLLVQGAVSGVAGGIAQRGIETGSLSKTFSPKAIAVDAALGAAGAGLGKVAVKVASRVAPKVAGAAKAFIARGKVAGGSRQQVVARTETEIVQRAMTRAELAATRETGLVRGGRGGTHYVSDAVNSNAGRAQQRLGLPLRPEVRVTMEVPAGQFSPPSTVQPYELPGGGVLPGGGTERTASGNVPARVLGVDKL